MRVLTQNRKSTFVAYIRYTDDILKRSMDISDVPRERYHVVTDQLIVICNFLFLKGLCTYMQTSQIVWL